MEIRQATINDLNAVIELHKKYHIGTIHDADKPDGFVTTNFTPVQLENLVTKEKGITIATQSGNVVCYAMAASWEFWSDWPLFAHMIEKLPEFKFADTALTIQNSYQYGPICVDKSVRGTGLFERVFYASLASMKERYPIMATFINQINHRSYAAHTKKAPLINAGTFQFNQNDYYLMACSTVMKQ